ncbi:DUF1844 domain-containing protein [Novipirellula artificiosorum]|uniref:DUF1844 domain-containing protein n=1 Tax=Novipirellula artificiosorum TaxID=2528016 RepID=A0A5C6E051_9BACT|nr:DUF1844 domain-containing protein [Novipirellula artificiosorum]TWU42095.1 hypothetical protein Poly41_03910 [Novipirellula artificiosorum]
MNEDQDPAEEPKIIVDSDWKEQVAKEKEQAAMADAEPSSKSAETIEPETPVTTAEQDSREAPSSGEAPPPASFEVLVSMLFTQAMMMLGQMPDPTTGKANVNKPFAKHYIDTLDMLSEKTKGNLTDSESKMLSEALHAMRMMYVNVKSE